MKRIVICADGTWNRPEQSNGEDANPTNVLKLARGIAPLGDDGAEQVVFYDWGIGSYHSGVSGGAFAKGLEKNVMDGYRFLVHNYAPGDQVFLFGFSRGAYTVRSLCGMLNNCGILKGINGRMVEEAFEYYKNPDISPNGDEATAWKNTYAVPNSERVDFVGVWDTVGSVGLPFSLWGLIKDKHSFYDNKLGRNIRVARHALSLDEKRDDFKPTIWAQKPDVDLKQVWFSGVHSDVGGGYPPINNSLLSDIPLVWLVKQAGSFGLKTEQHLVPELNYYSEANKSYSGFMKLLGKHPRTIDPADNTKVHHSVKLRYDNSGYRSEAIDKYLDEHDTWPEIEED